MTCYLIKPRRLVHMPLRTSHYSEMLVLCNSQADCYTFALRIGAKVVHSVYFSYGLDNRGILVRFLTRARVSYLFQYVRTGFGASQTHIL